MNGKGWLRRRARSGITLMEVLISAFVLAVGLLGLASLLPVARYLMVDTSKYDRSNTLGRAAVNDFEIRGYLQPGGSQPFPPTLATPSGTLGLVWQQQWIAPMPCVNTIFTPIIPPPLPPLPPYQTSQYPWIYEPVFGTDAYQFLQATLPPQLVTLQPHSYYTMRSSSKFGPGNAAAPPTVPPTVPNPFTGDNTGTIGLPAMLALRPPFVFDPLAIANPQNERFTAAGDTKNGPTQFPVAVFGTKAVKLYSPVPRMFRITAASTLYTQKGPPALFPTPLPYAQAARTFTTTDELQFDMSLGREVRPTAGLIAVPSGYPTFPNPTPGAMPDSGGGQFSYIATLAPETVQWNKGPDGFWGTLADDDNDGLPSATAPTDDPKEAGWFGSDDILLTGINTNQSWNVAVTVVYKRQLVLVPKVYQSNQATAQTPPPPERMVYASILSAPQPLPTPPTSNLAQYNLMQANAGLGGGDVLLRTPNPSNPDVKPHWLDVKPNEWLMLSAYPSLAYGTGVAGGPMSQYNTLPSQIAVAKWYRVVSAGEVLPDPTLGGWMRQVTLAGDDWPAYDMYDALAQTPPALVPPALPTANLVNPTGYQTAYATLVTGAVAVYEDTIEIGH